MAVKRIASMVFYAAVFLAAAGAQPLGTGVISGTVVDAESGDGIRKAVVTLTLQGTPRRWATTRTDGSGRFQFEGLPAGKYGLRAAKANDGTATYGANSLRELGSAITLGDGETRPAVSLRFLRAASISGHVYDSDGDPVPGANVNLLRRGRNLGVPVLAQYRGAITDDRGEYRFWSVDPGLYYLRTTPGAEVRFGGLPASHHSILVDQYYGGARDPKDASPIHVRGSDSLAGLDFRLTSEPAVEVRGRIAGVPEGPELPPTQPAGSVLGVHMSRTVTMSGRIGGLGGGFGGQGVQVTISPADTGQEQWSSGSVATGPDYRFQMADVPAGRYRIEAVYESGDKSYGASQVFDLHPDSNEIALTLSPAVEIQGTLKVEGEAPRDSRPAVVALGGNGFSVQLRRPDTRQNVVTAEIGPDGRFSLPQILPGEWQLAVIPAARGFLKSARFGDKDVRFTTFETPSNGDTPLNIVVSMHTATVEGEVDAGSSEARRAGILLAPVGPYHNLARFYYGATAGDDGKFHLGGMAPGKYKVFALEKMAAASFRNPEAADQLDELGEVVDVGEGATVQAHPKLIPADRAAQALQ